MEIQEKLAINISEELFVEFLQEMFLIEFLFNTFVEILELIIKELQA